jgi:hypothetical protein
MSGPAQRIRRTCPFTTTTGAADFRHGARNWRTQTSSAHFLAGGFRGTLKDIRILSRNDSGRVATLALDG